MAEYESRVRVARVIPYGYEVDKADDKLLLPIPEELKALDKALYYVNKGGRAYLKMSQWLTHTTGRYISDVGLMKINKRRKKELNTKYYNAKVAKAKIKKRDKELTERLQSLRAQETVDDIRDTDTSPQEGLEKEAT